MLKPNILGVDRERLFSVVEIHDAINIRVVILPILPAT